PLSTRASVLSWLGGTQLYSVHLLFEPVEGGIADFAATAQAKQRTSGRIHRAQTQAVGRAIRISRCGLAVRPHEGVLEFDAQSFGKPRLLALERSQRRLVGHKAGARHLLPHRIVVTQIKLHEQWAQGEPLQQERSKHDGEGDKNNEVAKRE